ncbi:protein Jumonji-like [Penaeus indicus]|uniref:protein Jumonji-like n=1 Tax=Penaeus indicus TaxID=29960 RepID=UPI00300D5CD2
MCKLPQEALSKYCGLAKECALDIRYPVHTLEVKATREDHYKLSLFLHYLHTLTFTNKFTRDGSQIAETFDEIGTIFFKAAHNLSSLSFKALHECCEPSMFSLDRLVLSVITDPRVTLDGLLRARELALQVVEKEKRLRAELSDIGLQASERLSTPDSHRKKKSRFIEDEEENMCEVCRQNLYVALVTNSQEEAVYCLEHALIFLKQNPTHLEYCKLMYTYSLSELDISLKQMDERIHIKSGKKSSPNTKRTKTREHLDSVSSTSSSNL